LSRFGDDRNAARRGISRGETCSESKPLKECAKREPARFISHVRRPQASLPWRGELLRVARAEQEPILYRIGVGAEHASCYPREKLVKEGREIERAASWEGCRPAASS
jgi:hypothetical protein